METRYSSEVAIDIGPDLQLEGELVIPLKATGIVIFSHGSGSSRHSPRNKKVAHLLQANQIGTLLFDLLTPQEDSVYATRFNIDLLTRRLVLTTQWLVQFEPARNCRFGYFGASTGAASALTAAALLPEIKAVISRGGRPDLAMDMLHRVHAPTLLIVGSIDHDVLRLNEQAFEALTCEKKLAVVEGASHLFSEKGALEMVADMAIAWCRKYLTGIAVA
jgi:pimeloyl-ACP methyl ester carboxylesterase